MISMVLTPILVIVAILYWRLQSNSQAARQQKLGGDVAPLLPSPDPFGLVNIWKLLKELHTGKILQHFHHRYSIVSERENRKVYTFQTHIFGNYLFSTCDPKNIQALLATQFDDFELGPLRRGTFEPLLGHGIFSVDGKQWQTSRALLRPQFARNQVSDLELEERHFQYYLQKLQTGSDGWTDVVDLQDLNFKFTMDTASEFLLGRSTLSQLSDDSRDKAAAVEGQDLDFVSAFDRSQDIIAAAFRLNDLYKLGLTKELYSESAKCHRFIDTYVHEALDKHQKGVNTDEKSNQYVFLDEIVKHTQDPLQIRYQILSIMLAGRDTTASTLGFLWLSLGSQPKIFHELRRAVLRDIGSDVSQISFESLKSCQYLQWCINETLRLFPVVPLNSRRSTKDTTLPRGGGPDGKSPVFVAKNTEVNYQVYAMHREPEFWGEDPNSFVPERWNTKTPPTFQYLPFNAGPRICLGQQFALTELAYVIVRLLQNFDDIDGSKAAITQPTADWTVTLTGRPMHGVHLRLHRAN